MKKILVALILLTVCSVNLQAKKKKGYDLTAEKSWTKIEKALYTSKGKRAKNVELLKKEYIFLYFSASWCPPCRTFTPKLIEFYNKNKANGNLEVIEMPQDKSDSATEKYMKKYSMPWPGLKVKTYERAGLAKFAGKGIPCLVLLDNKGNVLAHSYKDGKYVGPSSALREYEKIMKNKK